MCSCLHHIPCVFLIASISRDTCILNNIISGMHAWGECVTALCICCYGDVFDVISLVSSEHLSRWEVNTSSQWHGRIKQLLVSRHQQDWTNLHLLISVQSSDLRAGHQHCGLSVVLRWTHRCGDCCVWGSDVLKPWSVSPMLCMDANFIIGLVVNSHCPEQTHLAMLKYNVLMEVCMFMQGSVEDNN